jgi:hypothetical protein
MSYSEFKIEDIRNKLNLTLQDTPTLFPSVQSIQPSALLREVLQENIPLALGIDTEKARSELIVAPILVEFRKQCDRQISFFSGIDLTVDREQGLNGTCDFIISHSPEQLFLNAPIFTLVEAKNDNIKSGIPQCIAEMVAARMFNQAKNNPSLVIYGAVTTGSLWRFLRLEHQQVQIDLTEYTLTELEQIFGILMQIIQVTRPQAV